MSFPYGMGEAKESHYPWGSPYQSSSVGMGSGVSQVSESMFRERNGASPYISSNNGSYGSLGFAERSLSAAGSAFLSAVLVNPLDVVKTRLQAQAAGSHPLSNITSRMAYFGPTMMFADLRCSPSCTRAGMHGTVVICPPDCFQYKGTLDVFYKIIRQEGIAGLWRGTNAGLALAIPTVGIYLPCYDVFRNWLEELTAQNAPALMPYVPLVAGSMARSLACTSCYPIELTKTRMQAFKVTQSGSKPPGVWETLFGAVSRVKSTTNPQNGLQSYRILWTGLGAQLARDVPFSAICWSTLEPIRRKLLGLFGDEADVATILGTNFSAGFVAGSLAAAATCPLDVVKTRRQIETDPARALRMTTRRTLVEIWRDCSRELGLVWVVRAPRSGLSCHFMKLSSTFYTTSLQLRDKGSVLQYQLRSSSRVGRSTLCGTRRVLADFGTRWGMTVEEIGRRFPC